MELLAVAFQSLPGKIARQLPEYGARPAMAGRATVCGYAQAEMELMGLAGGPARARSALSGLRPEAIAIEREAQRFKIGRLGLRLGLGLCSLQLRR